MHLVVHDHDGAGRTREHAENRAQAVSNAGDARACVGGERFKDFFDFVVGRSGRLGSGVLEATPRPRQRQPFLEYEPLDTQHLIEIGLSVQARTVG